MAKRAPTDDKPFNALDKGLAASVMNPTSVVAEPIPTFREVETKSEPVRRAEVPVTIQPKPAERPEVPPRRPAANNKAPAIEAPEKLAREKRVLLSASEEREIERCVDRVAEAFGSPVKLSHIIRACLTVVRHAEKEISLRANEAGTLQRPANGDVIALAEFEHAVAKVLSQAFRDAPSLR